MTDLKFVSLNVRGLRDAGKRSALFFSLLSMDFEVAFLQECHLKSEEDTITFTKEWTSGVSYWSIGNVHSDGLGIVFKNNGFMIENYVSLVPGRLQCLDARWGEYRFRFINVYAPCVRSKRLDFFKNLPNLWDTNRCVIMGGDFNITLDSLEKNGEVDFSGIYLKKELKEHSLQDAYREDNKDDSGFTWGNTRGNRGRLDYFFITQGIEIKELRILPCWCSDHEMVLVTIVNNEVNMGKGYWKMNISLLEDDIFKKEFKDFYKLWQEFKVGYVSLLEWWEVLKIEIAGFCIRYTEKKRRQERKEVWGDNNRLQKIMANQNGGLEVREEEIAEIKGKIKRYYTKKAKEFAFLAKIEEREKDEKVTKYFFQTIKQKQKGEIIDGFMSEKGEVKGKENTFKYVCAFYKELFF